jgi:DNA-3-methyladenine glycosylase I
VNAEDVLLVEYQTSKQIPARSPESERLSKDLKQRGFNFVGPTVTYAYMQVIGMVNDHTVDCFRFREIAREFADAN